jgi:hypothetical protein
VLGAFTAAEASASTGGSLRASARAYVQAHQFDIGLIRSSVEATVVVFSLVRASPTRTNLSQLTPLVLKSQGTIEDLQSDFTPLRGASPLDAAGNRFIGALKALAGSMDELVAYAATPSAASLARFRRGYRTAAASWNAALGTIWRAANEAPPLLAPAS